MENPYVKPELWPRYLFQWPYRFLRKVPSALEVPRVADQQLNLGMQMSLWRDNRTGASLIDPSRDPGPLTAERPVNTVFFKGRRRNKKARSGH